MTDALTLKNPAKEVDRIVQFLRKTFDSARKTHGVIAVSGGIDSALSLTLAINALSPKNVFPVLLPYKSQNMTDAQTICRWNNIPEHNITAIQIEPMVSAASAALNTKEAVRLGNMMARVRMIAVYDLAKHNNALVVGTENKSEHYLGYFTRFGDAASDIEPISTLYKTQVRQLAAFLKIPQEIIEKHPSAGLWEHQTDELELGFTYEAADRILHAYLDEKKTGSAIALQNISRETVNAVLARVSAQHFKLETPYTL
jgi:NAD+ synthase